MTLGDQFSGNRNAIAMITSCDVLAYRPARCFLHRRTLERRSLAQGGLLLLRQPERHSHSMDGISSIPLRAASNIYVVPDGAGDRFTR